MLNAIPEAAIRLWRVDRAKFGSTALCTFEAAGPNVMPDTEVEQSGVVPASKTVDGDIANAQGQNGAKSEGR